MKNNCDVSRSRPFCCGETGYSGCAFFGGESIQPVCWFFDSNTGSCNSTAAIRAAIEAENESLRCCGNCDSWEIREDETAGHGMEYICNSDGANHPVGWDRLTAASHVCTDWKAREKVDRQ